MKVLLTGKALPDWTEQNLNKLCINYTCNFMSIWLLLKRSVPTFSSETNPTPHAVFVWAEWWEYWIFNHNSNGQHTSVHLNAIYVLRLAYSNFLKQCLFVSCGLNSNIVSLQGSTATPSHWPHRRDERIKKRKVKAQCAGERWEKYELYL